MAQQSSPIIGIGFLPALFLVLLVLKLCGTISWSWLWVTAPLWAPLAAVIAVVGVCALVAGFAAIVIGLCDRR